MSAEGLWPLLFAALLLTACASTQPEPEQQEESESGVMELKMAVKTSLLEAEGVAATPVRTEVAGDGSVRLTGYVSSEEESRRAEQAARQALPEAEIHNELRVWRPGRQNNRSGTDIAG